MSFSTTFNTLPSSTETRGIATRKSHNKSRTGCVACKQKKIKPVKTSDNLGLIIGSVTWHGLDHECTNFWIRCCEGKPACRYCLLRSQECVYPTFRFRPSNRPVQQPLSGTTSPNVTTSETNRVIDTTTRSLISGNDSPSLVIPVPSSVTSKSLPGGRWTTLDLELLHFFSTSTCFTFSPQPQRQQTWQHFLPQLAFSHDFLLHGILAMAALHLSTVTPDRKESLRAYAVSHQDTAVSLFRVALSQIDSRNCHACCAYSGILPIFKCASPEGNGMLFFSDSGEKSQQRTLEWIQLLRGAGQVIKSYYFEVLESPMKSIVQDQEAEDSAKVNPAEPARFDALKKFIDESGTSLSNPEIDALKGTLQRLQDRYNMMCNKKDRNVDTTSLGLSWAILIPDEFLTLVNKRSPIALIILAHFSLLLHKMENTWWVSGLSRGLLQHINQILGKEWETWLSWPLQDLVLNEFATGRLGDPPRMP